MELTELRHLYKERGYETAKEVTVGGWVRSIRDSKTFGFMVISDGSCFETLQIVFHDPMENFSEIAHTNGGAAVSTTTSFRAAFSVPSSTALRRVPSRSSIPH